MNSKSDAYPKRFYKDIQMIGRHYLVSEFESGRGHRVKRHYTIANCMESNAYAYYMQLLAYAKTGEKPSINAENVLRNDG